MIATGRLAGWRSMFSLDDDIEGITPAFVRRAAGAVLHRRMGVPLPSADDLQLQDVPQPYS
jgi:hypothetical protein